MAVLLVAAEDDRPLPFISSSPSSLVCSLVALCFALLVLYCPFTIYSTPSSSPHMLSFIVPSTVPRKRKNGKNHRHPGEGSPTSSEGTKETTTLFFPTHVPDQPPNAKIARFMFLSSSSLLSNEFEDIRRSTFTYHVIDSSAHRILAGYNIEACLLALELPCSLVDRRFLNRSHTTSSTA
jgi:hypothetical protein